MQPRWAGLNATTPSGCAGHVRLVKRDKVKIESGGPAGGFLASKPMGMWAGVLAGCRRVAEREAALRQGCSVRFGLGFGESGVLEAVAFAGDGDDGGVMEEAVEDGPRGGDVLEEFSPVLERAVAGHDGGAGFVAAHDDLEQVLPGVLGQGAQTHVVDDQEVGLDVLLEHAIALLEGIVGQEVADQVKDRAVADDEALLDRLIPDGLGEHGFADARRADEQNVGFCSNEVAGSQFVDLLLGDRGIEAPFKLVERLEGAEVRHLDPALDLALQADVDFVLQHEGQKLLVGQAIGSGFLESD